ncbi:hypothetical protein ACF1BQ_014660 [Bradyrhizobium sp. RDT10]
MAIQITSIDNPAEGHALWTGTAIKDGTNVRWFIDLDDDGGFKFMEEEVTCRHIAKDGDWRYCFLYVDPPDGAKEAVLKAIRGTYS